MIERLEVVVQGLAADRNALFDDQSGFKRAERVAFECVLGVCNLDIVVLLKVGKAPLATGAAVGRDVRPFRSADFRC
jgi:hypothetical protein